MPASDEIVTQFLIKWEDKGTTQFQLKAFNNRSKQAKGKENGMFNKPRKQVAI